MNNKLQVIKNEKVHIEGARNDKACKCFGCGLNVPMHMGRKAIYGGTYYTIHHSNSCLESAELKAQALLVQSMYKHNLEWNVRVTFYEAHKSLSVNGSLVSDRGHKASITCQSLNKLKGLRGIVDDIESINIKLTLPDGFESYFDIDEYEFFDYQGLLNKVIISSKVAIFSHYDRYDKMTKLYQGTYKALVHSNFSQILQRLKV